MKRALSIIILLSVVLSSCVKMNREPKPVDPFLGPLQVPADFDWKTVKELTLSISVTAVNASLANSVHVIRVYNSPLLNSGSLLATGAAKQGAPYNVKLSIAAPTQKIYIHETKPNGLVKVTEVTVNNTSLNITLSALADNSLVTKSNALYAESASFTSPSIVVPTNFDVVINNNNNITTTGFGTGETSAHGNTYKSYLIPAGFTRTADITFSHGTGYAIVYVQGTLNMSGDIALNRTSIVVLPGGQVTSRGMSTGAAINPVPRVYIFATGSMRSTKHITLSNSAVAVNKGSWMLDGNNMDFSINSNAELFNEGTITVQNQRSEILVTNGSKMYNSHRVNSPHIDLTVNATYLNDLSAVTEVNTWYQSNGTVLDNFGELNAAVQFKASGGGVLNNYCRLSALESDIQAYTANLESGSLWISQNFKANNSTINMIGGSMFQTAGVSEIFRLNVRSTSTPFALFVNTGNMPDLRWAQVSFSGNIEYVQQNMTEGTGSNGRGLYEGSFSNGAILAKTQTKNIVGTSCNLSLGQIEAPPGGGGGGGAPDPQFGIFFPSETGWGTFAFEDLWPNKGDYDLNDLVLGFRITFLANSSNLITELHFDYKIKAVGATKTLGAAFQLDGINASNVGSVTGQKLGSSGMFTAASNGAESGVATAVIPIFNTAHGVESFTGFLNTQRGSYQATGEYKVVVKFVTPVSQSALNMSTFNFFITPDARGKEVHLPGFAATSRFSPSFITGGALHPNDMFKNADGMMFGLMFADSFDYPAERNSIIDTYTHFAAWATSGGAQYPDWYTNKEGYRNLELVY